jgi:ankyrin repeat protein
MKEPAKMLKYLAAHGADPNYPAGDGSTPLENQSTGSGNVEIMKALLEAGAEKR